MKKIIALLCLSLPLLNCSAEQSALAPTGVEAGEVSRLFWAMTVFLGLVMAGVVAAVLFAIVGGARVRAHLSADRFIVGAGVAFPVVSLLILLTYGLSAMTSRAWPPTADMAFRVTVVGEQWWWRIVYHCRTARSWKAPTSSLSRSASKSR